MQPHLLFAFTLCLTSITEAAQILAFFPVPIKSHQFVFQPLLKSLAQRGHQVTYVTPFPMSEQHKNIKEIIIEDIFKELENNQLAADPYSFRHDSGFKLSLFHWGMGINICQAVLSKPRIQEFIQQKNIKFDVIIAETLFAQEPFIGLSSIFQAPIVDFSSQCGTHVVHEMLFNPTTYSYVTDYRTIFSDRMSLYERLMNTLLGLFQVYGSYWYYFPIQEEVLYTNFNISDSTGKAPSLKHLLQSNIVAAIFNSDPVLGYPRPLLPNSIEVGGISLQPRKPLPKELQNFMDEATSGVIYVSFGSILAAEQMPEKQKKYFIEAFKRLKQKVMWKYESALDTELSANVLIQRWFPQRDILAHPNCQLFITHGGYLSLVDTADAGVPIIGIPFFADQPKNTRMAQEKGFGVHLNFDDITPDLLVDTVQKIVTNKSYSDNAKQLSAIFKDRLVSPVDKAVHLVEYVSRHGGNPSSRTGVKDLWWFQYFLLDVIAIIITVLSIVFIVLYKIFRFIFSLLCCRFNRSSETPAKSKKMKKKTN